MYRLEIYQDKARRYRWRLRAKNRLIVADSGQGYASRGGASQAFFGVRRVLARGGVTVAHVR